MFIERTARPAQRASSFNGTLNFNTTRSNPFDTNFGWANALLGTVNSYPEATAHPFAEGRFNQIEFFAQDNWRLKRKIHARSRLRVRLHGPTYVGGSAGGLLRSGEVRPRQGADALPARVLQRRGTCSGTPARGAEPATRASC